MQEEDIMNRLSLGLSEFDNIIKENKIYVDKTKFIKKMMDQGRKYYFLSRPRRFGKTLLVSTLENFFQGKKELFKDTYIYDNWEDWSEYPIIRISMSDILNTTPRKLKNGILNKLDFIASIHDIELDKTEDYVSEFSKLIYKIYKNNEEKEVIVLIDEYDAPILDHINNTGLASDNRKILQNFYNVLKNNEEHLKFVFITGITKFTKTSIFSKFNNFVELTLHEDYTTICGITHKEFKHYYHDQIEVMALKNKLTYDEVLDKFNHWYDGYSWDGINKVYNPFSTLNALYERKFMGFWFGSGTPTFLAETFKHKEIIEDYSKPRELKYTELDAIDPENINLTALLFQGGYLTIDKEFIQEDIIRFSLKIPNFEVEQAYKDNLLNIYLNEVEEDIIDVRGKLWEDIKKGDCESLSDYLEIQFDEIPYHLNLTNKRDRWKVKQIIFLKLVEYMGFKAKGEVAISQGRIDAVFRNKNHIIVSEVKYTQNQKKSIDDLMNKSLNQIHEKQYYRIYKKKNYTVILLALAFKDVKINKKDILTEVKCKIEILNN